MRVVLVGALNGAIAVAAGAFGAHLLGNRVPIGDADLWQTATSYQLVHAAALVGIGWLKGHVLPALLGAASWALALGVVLFCGSLYILALGGMAAIGFVTPIGGALLLLGWLLLAVAAARRV